MKDLTIDSACEILTYCRALVPGAEVIEVEPLDVRVKLGTTTFRAFWWTWKDEANWAYEITGKLCVRDSGPLEDVEELTLFLHETFGPTVLVAMLVAALAADAMDVARQIVAMPKDRAWWLDADTESRKLREHLWAAFEARDLHLSSRLLLSAVAMVAPELGRGWKRTVLTGEPWNIVEYDL